jgi:penicillin amidase
MWRFISWLFLILIIGVSAVAQDTGTVKIEGLTSRVEVRYDNYGMPHIFAGSWSDAYRSLGYIHATDRFWQMDLFRRRASGTLAEVQGQAGLAEDIFVRRLGIRRGCQEVWDSRDLPEALRTEMESYTSGVNAKLAEFRAQNQLPPMMQYEPAPWNPVDCMVFLKYMAWDQSGNDDDLWFGAVLEKLGATTFGELWPLERPYEEPTVTVQVEQANLERMLLTSCQHSKDAYEAALAQIPQTRWLGDSSSFGSNNWAVSGKKTASGKPILCSDPHLGFQLPSIWYAWHICIAGRNIAGVGFPGSPITIIGFNDFLAWGITNLQADAVDYFVETVDEKDPLRYLHRGDWKQMTRITEEIAVRGGQPQVLHIDSTVHGPVITREGRTVSMQWTGLGATREIVSIWTMNRASNLKEWLAGARQITAPGLNLAYADVYGNIALYCCGRFPIRMRGQGRVPMDGASGDYDWTEMIPADEMPFSLNPPEGYIASANGRPTPVGYPHYIGWMWDPSYRKRRIDDMLAAAHDLTVETMKPVQYDHYDKAAAQFVPVWLEVVKGAKPDDAFAGRVIEAMEQWDFVADVDAVQPLIWLRWLDHYRKAVWDDEWKQWGVEKKHGSWGFTGINQSEPILEVLEYMTREYPDSIWFDDKGTPERERRDDAILKSFSNAVASLKAEFGDDLGKYKWGKTNVLKIRSMVGVPGLSRTGGPVPGTSFTVNPGGDIGPVGGGASWRMIIDLGATDASVGIYPGGQSGIPDNPHYADLMPLWEKGEYIPLKMVSAPEKLAGSGKQVVFEP